MTPIILTPIIPCGQTRVGGSLLGTSWGDLTMSVYGGLAIPRSPFLIRLNLYLTPIISYLVGWRRACEAQQ